MKVRNMIMLLVVLMTTIMASALVSAQTIPLDIEYVEVNDEKYFSETTIAERVERGEELDIEVKVFATEDVEDIVIEAYISGYRYSHYEGDLVRDSTRTFDLDANTSDKHNLKLQIPVFEELKDAKLRVRVSNANDPSVEQVYQLRIRGLDESEAIKIRDFRVSPSSAVVAGRPLSFKVWVENLGDDDRDDVSVSVSIPELGLVDYEYLDELDADETETFEELLLRIPTCTEPGVYTATAEVEFDRFEKTSETMSITVLESDACDLGKPSDSSEPKKSRTVVTVPDSQEVVMGTAGAVYPVMISNLGSTAKTYTIAVSGIDAWGTVRLDPSPVVVVQPESVKTVYMYVTAKDDAAAGGQVFKLSVESENDVKDVVLTATVKESDGSKSADGSYDGLRKGLEIGLIILVIILIILGLIIGFNKLRGDRDDSDDETQTYY